MPRRPKRTVGMNSRTLLLVTITLLLAGCTITHSVEQVGNRNLPAVLCIAENDTVWSKEFLPWLETEFRRHGFETSVYHGTPPKECHLRATYWANWGWDLAVYLKYAEISLYEDATLVGRVIYDATGAFANMGKFGRTENKLRPLIDELLSGATISPSGTPSSAAQD